MPDAQPLIPEPTEAVLDNGLTVLIQESRSAPVVSCWAGYRAGVRNERPGITGASHWVEHMTFKGTDRLKKGDVFLLTARHGGSNNGYTTDDVTLYYETLPAQHLELALLIESQRMSAVTFDPDETESERTVILAERDGNENNPRSLLSEAMRLETYREHPYRWPIIGTRPDLEAMTHAQLLDHYRSYYMPGNAVLSIVGDVDAGRALEQVQEHFGSIPAGEAAPAPETREPAQQEPRRTEVRRQGTASYLQVAYHGPEAGHPDCYPLTMLDAVLSGGKGVSWSSGGYMGRTARVYRALVEAQLAVSAGTSFRFSLDPATFHASLTLRAGVEPEVAEAALLGVMEDAAQDPPTADEMARALRQTEAQFAYSRDGVTNQAFALLYFQLLGDWRRLSEHLDRLRAVTPEEVARVAGAYLRPENRTTGWFIPTPE
jgi:zinc protease